MAPSDLRNLAPAAVDIPAHDKLGADGATHPPRILILYGSLRPQSYSRKLALEAERLLRHFGAETRVFDPHDLPMADSVGADHRSEEHTSALQSLIRISYAAYCLNKKK